MSALGNKNKRSLKLPRAGRLVNDAMPSYCANQIINYLKQNSKNLENIKIGILGYSFKNNSGDIRFTPIKNFIEILFELGCNQISIFDSAISNKETLNKNLTRTQNWQDCIKMQML